MHTRIEKSESLKEFAKDFIKMQKLTKNIERTAQAGKKNSKFNYKYAKLDKVIDVLKPLWTEHNFFVQQWIVSNKEECRLETFVGHISGEWMSAMGSIPRFNADSLENDSKKPFNKFADEKEKKSNPVQDEGSAITYLRRYTLMAIINVIGENEDNDGNPYSQEPSRYEPIPPMRELTIHEKLDVAKKKLFHNELKTLEEFMDSNNFMSIHSIDINVLKNNTEVYKMLLDAYKRK